MLVVVAIQAEQLPVGAILGVVVVVVVTVMDGQLTQALAGEFTGTAATHVRVHLQRFVAITHFAVALGVGENAVELGGIGWGCCRTHGFTFIGLIRLCLPV
ncbi:hypothetical protein D3C85_1399480 [compost metagenome]